MSHIVSLRIDGLAGRKGSVEFELNRDTNIFFGLNGCGKTSLLKILHAAMSNETVILRNVPFTSAEVEIYSLNWKTVFKRSIKKPKLPRSKGSMIRRVSHDEIARISQLDLLEEWTRHEKLEWTCTPTTPKSASSTHWAHEYLPVTRLHVGDEFYIQRSGDSSLTDEQLDAFFATSVQYLWERYSAEVSTAVRTAQEQGLASILRAVLSSKSEKDRGGKNTLLPGIAYPRVQNFLKRQGSAFKLGTQSEFEERFNADHTVRKVVQDINLIEDKIETAMSSRNELQQLITRMYTGNKEIHFSDRFIDVVTESGDQIGLESLSSGEKHLLRILVQSLLAGQSSMMIDEPELSMHVDWQKNLIQSLRALNGQAQLILATHSPEIMADVPDDKIFRI
jgi:predicted ATPase